MITTDDPGLASIIRTGDFFVVKSGANGLSVEYSPDAALGAPVSGAFASIQKQLIVWTEKETAQLLKDKGDDTEAFLMREARRQLAAGALARVNNRREPVFTDNLKEVYARLLKGFAKEYHSQGGCWHGLLKDFHAEITNRLFAAPLTTRTRSALLNLERVLPGIRLKQTGKGFNGYEITVDWEALGSE